VHVEIQRAPEPLHNANGPAAAVGGAGRQEAVQRFHAWAHDPVALRAFATVQRGVFDRAAAAL